MSYQNRRERKTAFLALKTAEHSKALIWRRFTWKHFSTSRIKIAQISAPASGGNEVGVND